MIKNTNAKPNMVARATLVSTLERLRRGTSSRPQSELGGQLELRERLYLKSKPTKSLQ